MTQTKVEVIEPTINNASEPAAATAADLTNGNKYVNNGSTICIITNTDAIESLDITITTARASSGNKEKTLTKTIAAEQTCIVNYLDSDFNTDGFVTIAYSGSSSSATIVAISPSKN